MNSNTEKSYRYWAFISYSHQDKKWGDWLHRALETYRVPKSLIGKENWKNYSIPKRVFPIFRDREELPTAADLGENIHTALRESRHLIVICSPSSAKSRWVNEEIKFFKSLGRENSILCLIVDGEPNATDKPELEMQECFPEALKYRLGSDGDLSTERVEPIAADARKNKDEKNDAKLKLLAGLLGIGFDQLKQRDQRRRRQRFIALTTVLVLLLLIISSLGILSFFQWRHAEKNLIEANHNYGLALLEKAEAAEKEKDFNAAHVYALHARKNMKQDDRKNQLRAANIIYNNPIYPIIFRTPNMASHKGRVTSVAFSPDGKTLASGSWDNTVILWDVSTGEVKSTLKGHTDDVTHISFSADGRTLASGSGNGTIILWDVVTGEDKTTLKSDVGKVNSVTFTPDGTILASGMIDNTVILWDIGSGEIKNTLKGHKGTVESISFSPDGKALASGAWDKTIILWDMMNGESKSTLKGHKDFVNCISFSPDGKTLASGSQDSNVILWDMETGQVKSALKGHAGSVESVSFSPSGKSLASGSSDKTVILWNVETGERKCILKGHTDTVSSVSYSPDGRTIASGSWDKTVVFWDVFSGEVKSVLKQCLLPLAQNLSNSLNKRMSSPDGKTLVYGSTDKTVILWDPAIRNIFTSNLSFSPNGKTLASGLSDKTVILWDVISGEVKSRFKGHTHKINSVSFSPDGKTLASGSSDKTIILWDVVSGEVRSRFKGHTHDVNSVSFSPDGKTLASGSSDKTIILWDVMTGKKKSTLKGHTANVHNVTFSPDGKALASGSWDNTVVLWNVETGEMKNALKGHMKSVTSISFSPDGKILASGSEDDTVIIWDVVTGETKGTLKGHTDSVFSVSFSPDGKTLASGSWDKTVILWDTVSGEEKAILRRLKAPILSVAFNPEEKILAYSSLNYTQLVANEIFGENNTTQHSKVTFWNLSKNWENIPALISDTMSKVYLSLEGIELIPSFSILHNNKNYSSKIKKPRWSQKHPFYWLSVAEKGDSNAMLQLGLIYDRSDDLEKAEEWYNKASAAGEKEAKSRLEILAQRLLYKKKLAAEQLWKLIPQKIRQDQYDTVFRFCNLVLKLDPDHIDALWIRGKIMFITKNEPQIAEQDFRRVCRLSPDFADPFGYLGWLLITQKRFQEAEPFCEKAHELAPENWAWTTNFAHLNLLKGEIDKAYALYREAINRVPDRESFEKGPVADLNLFIEKGWQEEACQKALSWMRDEFNGKMGKRPSR